MNTIAYYMGIRNTSASVCPSRRHGKRVTRSRMAGSWDTELNVMTERATIAD